MSPAKSAPPPPAPQAQSVFNQDMAAKLIMITDRHLRTLIRDGWITKELTIQGVVQGYIRYRDDLDKRRQQNTARSEAQQLQNDKARFQMKVVTGEYIESGLALTAYSEVTGGLRADLETIPSRFCGRDMKARKELESLIAEALNSAADKCDEAVAALSPAGGNSQEAAKSLTRRLGAAQSEVPFKRGRPRSKRPVANALRH